MTDLPEGWEWTTIGEIASLIRGVTFKKQDASQTDGAGLTPIIRAGNIQDDKLETDRDLIWVPNARIKPEQRIRAGDTVIATSSGSLSIVGKSAHVSKDAPFAHGAFMTVVRPTDIDGRYLSYRLQSSEVRSRWSAASSGTNINNLKKGDLTDTPVPVAPRAEQERIVAAIEEHHSRLDAAEAGLTAAEGRMTALVESAMLEAFRRSSNVERIGDVSKVGSGATPKRTDSRFWEHGDIPWVTSGALHTSLITEPSAFITEAALSETSVKLWPAGTVLLAMYGEGKTRGRAAELRIDSTCNQACAAIRPDPSVLRSAYLRWFLNSRYEQNRRLASGGVQPNLSLGLVKEMSIPVLDLETQDRIVDSLEAFAKAVDQTRLDVATASSRAEAFRRSILAAAFSGKLVPQDSSDEPASMLLNRIRAEQAAVKPKRRTKIAKT